MFPRRLCASGLILAAALVAGSWIFISGVAIQAKAVIAQMLLESSWKDAQSGALRPKPWPWADTWPVARLTGSGFDEIILSQASGRNLAFGPAHLPPSAMPGHSGHVVISGHRDTHFQGLGNLRSGDQLTLEHQSGLDRYQVEGSEILDLKSQSMQLWPEQDRLTLVTCYPLGSWFPGTSRRYLVHLKRVDL